MDLGNACIAIVGMQNISILILVIFEQCVLESQLVGWCIYYGIYITHVVLMSVVFVIGPTERAVLASYRVDPQLEPMGA